MTDAPIVIFAHARPRHLASTLEALAGNPGWDRARVIAFSDGAAREEDQEMVRAVRARLRQITGVAGLEIVERSGNLGLARSVIDGIDAVLRVHRAAIVVEDDVRTAPQFLTFMNEALSRYVDRPRVFSATGYRLPPSMMPPNGSSACFTLRPCSWGWATWTDRWKKVDWSGDTMRDLLIDGTRRRAFERAGEDLVPMAMDQLQGRNDSWAIRFAAAQFISGGYTVCPPRSLVDNIGFDGTGRHSGVGDRYRADLSHAMTTEVWPTDVEHDGEAIASIVRAFRQGSAARLSTFARLYLGAWRQRAARTRRS